MKNIKEITNWLKERKSNILNPDDLSWDDMGFSEESGKEMEAQFGSKETYLEYGDVNEFNESQYAQLQLIGELLDLIKKGE